MEEETIPIAAVEAAEVAQRAHWRKLNGRVDGVYFPCPGPSSVRAAIEAAVPFLVAKAFREAADELEGSKGVPGFPYDQYTFRAWLRDRADALDATDQNASDDEPLEEHPWDMQR